MPFNDARAGWVIATAAIVFAAIGGLITLSAQAGQLQQRVSVLEVNRQMDSAKIDHVLDSLARIEARLEMEEKDREDRNNRNVDSRGGK